MRNAVKTTFILTLLAALFVGIGALIGGKSGLIIGLAFGLLFTGGSYWFSDKIAIKAARAAPVSEAQMPDYYAVVRDLTTRAGMPMPKLYVTPDAQPNAFATGRNPDHAAVAVTQGILEICTWDEIRGVLAHEISHVGNRDILISSVAATIAMAITLLATIARWAAIFGGGTRQRRPEHLRDPGPQHPRPPGGHSPAAGPVPEPGVRGRPLRRPAHRRRRAAGPGLGQARGRRPADPDAGRAPGDGAPVHREPPGGDERVVQEPVLGPSADGRPHRPSALEGVGPLGEGWAGPIGSGQSRMFSNCSGSPKSSSRRPAMTACRSSRFLPDTRT